MVYSMKKHIRYIRVHTIITVLASQPSSGVILKEALFHNTSDLHSRDYRGNSLSLLEQESETSELWNRDIVEVHHDVLEK